MRLLLIAAAGGLGTLARYWAAVLVGGRAWPVSTLAVNVAGAFALGLLVGRGAVSASNVTAAIAIGFLGAFTTFSTFSVEAVDLLRNGRPGAAFAYVAASVGLGLVAAAAGYAITAR